MDIVKRAYLNVTENMDGDPNISGLTIRVRAEVVRLIKAHAYERRVWPPEFGPLPDELKGRMSKEATPWLP